MFSLHEGMELERKERTGGCTDKKLASPSVFNSSFVSVSHSEFDTHRSQSGQFMSRVYVVKWMNIVCTTTPVHADEPYVGYGKYEKSYFYSIF